MPTGSRTPPRRARRSPPCSRSATRSSTCAGAASRPGSRSATWRPNVTFENHTSHPAPGEVLLYPGGYSETEILFPYGGTCFSSIVGQLAGNHFLTVTEGREHLRELGRLVLWEGAQDIEFDRA